MTAQNRGLGKGIEALFESAAKSASMAARAACGQPLQTAPIDSISPSPDQPREMFTEEALANLAESIRRHGILQPLLVRPGSSPENWQLIAGERRLRAAKLAGLTEVPIIAKQTDDREALVLTLLENLQREDLNPIEEAKGLDSLRQAMNMSIEEMASSLGQPRSTVSNILRLLKLHPAIQDELAVGRITSTHAKILGGLPSEDAALELCRAIVENDLNTRETEEAVAFWNTHQRFPWDSGKEQSGRVRKGGAPDPEMQKLAMNIGATLNCRARISGNPAKGRISLAYESNEQLYQLLERLGMSLQP